MACCCLSNPRAQRINRCVVFGSRPETWQASRILSHLLCNRLASLLCRWTIFGLTCLSWALSVLTLADCDFLFFTNGSVNSVSLGLFNIENKDDGNCITYGERFDNNYLIKGAHKAAQVFGVVANVLLVLAFVGTSLVIFLLRDKAARIMWIGTRIAYVCALLAVLFTFSFFGINECTDDDAEICEFGGGAVVNSVNAWILIGIVSTCWCTPIPDEPVIKCGHTGSRKSGVEQPKEQQAFTMSSIFSPTPEVSKITETAPSSGHTKAAPRVAADRTESNDEESQNRAPQVCCGLAFWQ